MTTVGRSIRRPVQAVHSEWNIDPVLAWPERNPEIWVIGSALLGVARSEVGLIATAHAAAVILTSVVVAFGSRPRPRLLIVMVYGGLSECLLIIT